MSEAGSPTSPRSYASISPVGRVKGKIKVAAVRPSWAILEEDEDEKQLTGTPKEMKPDDECTPGDFEHIDGHLDTENDSFLPKSPPQSKPPQKETRHWIPTTSRHVIISPEMLDGQLDLNGPYNPNPFNDPDLEKVLAIRKQKSDSRYRIQKSGTRWNKVQTTVLHRGYVPLMLRLISWIFSIAALFLAGFITRDSVVGGVETRPSTVMAFVANGIAIFYLPWVAKDEYFGKAIGIRSARAKLQLVLLDLVFITLNSADLALAFNVLYDSEAGCLTDSNNKDTRHTVAVCKLQQAMACVLFITLLGFVINFTVSLYRENHNNGALAMI